MATVRSLIAAALSFEIQSVSNLREHIEHVESCLDAAVAAGAELIVMPECIDLERLSYADPMPAQDQLSAILAPEAERVEAAMIRFAKDRKIGLVGGSQLVRNPDGQIINRSVLAFKDEVRFQEKLVLTGWERDEWNIAPGRGLHPIPPLGVTICYDCEFPGSGRALAEAGVLVHAIPAYTETEAGFRRVRWSAQARAVEHQVFVIHASLVGGLGREPVPHTFGTSALIAPSAGCFADQPILAETPPDCEGFAIAELNFDALLATREEGDVRNWNDRNAADWTVIS